MARVYAVASAKGGVGKTTTTANLGAVLASRGRRVAVVDADLGMPNLGDAFGVDADEATVHDVLAGRASVEDATYRGPNGLAIVPGDTDLRAFADAEPSGLRDVVDSFDDYEYVLLDTGAGLSHDSALPLGLAEEVLLVSTTDRYALVDTEKTRQLAGRLGGTVTGVVLTRVDPEHPNVESVAALLETSVIEAIPDDDVVVRALDDRQPVTAFAPDSPASRAYGALADAVVGRTDSSEWEADGVIESTDVSDGESEPPEDGFEMVGDDGEADDDDDEETGAADTDAVLVPDAEGGPSSTLEVSSSDETAADATTRPPMQNEGAVRGDDAASEDGETSPTDETTGEKKESTGFFGRLLK